MEVHALFDFYWERNRVERELSLDPDMDSYVHGLVWLGVLRLVLIVNMLIRSWKGRLVGKNATLADSLDSLGIMFTFVSDYAVIRMYLFVAYLYEYELELVMIITIIGYCYFKFARFQKY